MPAKTSCPSCGRELLVPEELHGKSVRCPSCDTVFSAQVQSSTPSPSRTPEGAASSDFERVRRDPVEPPRPKDDDRFEKRDRWEDDDDFGRIPRGGERSFRAGYRDALNAVSGPATSLLVTGWISAGLHILGLCLLAVQLGIGAGAAGAGAGMNKQNGPIDAFVGGAIAIPIRILGLILSALVIIGAGKMKRLESHGWAMASSIIAMIPCFGCCLLGLPFGIWSLVVLNKPEVKDAFRHVS